MQFVKTPAQEFATSPHIIARLFGCPGLKPETAKSLATCLNSYTKQSGCPALTNKNIQFPFACLAIEKEWPPEYC
jgi:hypothetical protein